MKTFKPITSGESKKLTGEDIPTGYCKMDRGKSKNLTEEEIPNPIKEDVENGLSWGGHAPTAIRAQDTHLLSASVQHQVK